MSWDIESLGSGGIGGIFIGVLTAFGLKSKMDKLEDKKQDRAICSVIHKSIEDKFSILIEGQTKLFDKVDGINEYLRNGK